jgi:hypothetical protein
VWDSPLERSLVVADGPPVGKEGGGEGHQKVASLSLPHTRSFLAFRECCRKGIPLCHRVPTGPEDKGRLEVGI